MSIGIEFVIVYLDTDLLELCISGSNGRFSGEANVYADYEKLAELPKKIEGFPKHPQDERNFEIGSFEPRFAGGGVRFHFRCIDSAGHSGVKVDFRADALATGQIESSSFFIPLEAAAVDSFVTALRNIELVKGANARLRATL